MKATEQSPSTAMTSTVRATSQRPKGMLVANHSLSRAAPDRAMPNRMASVVESLSSALARGTWACGKISGREPLSAGLKSAELAPMQNSMASMPPQFRVSRPQAPASMAATSSSLAASTT